MTTTLYSLKICNVSISSHIQYYLQCTYSSYIADMYILLKNSSVTCLDRMIIHNLNTNICIHNLHAHLYCIHILYVCNFLSYLLYDVERKCICTLYYYDQDELSFYYKLCCIFYTLFFKFLLCPIFFNEVNLRSNNK